jgi:myosin-7
MSAPVSFGGWVEAIDPKTSKPYYANVQTRETRWVPPQEFIDAKAAASGVAPSVPQSQAPSRTPSLGKKGGWKEQVDPRSGKTYYYHTVTRETVWTRPAEMDGGAPAALSSPTAAASASFAASPLPATIKAVSAASPAGAYQSSAQTPDDMETPDGEDTADDDTQDVQDDDNQADAIKEVTFVNIQDKVLLSDTIRNQIALYKLENYAKTYFKQHAKGWFSKASMDEMLSWSETIEDSLLKKLNKFYSDEAVEAFRSITGYMGDRKTEKPGAVHAYRMLKVAIGAPEEFRDEIYCQLCKQVNRNPNPASTVRGWKLFALCTGMFPPSEEFACYLCSFFFRTAETSGVVAEFAKYCLGRLDRTMADGARKKPPTQMEIDAVQERRPITIRVRFLDDMFKSLAIDSQTNARDVCKNLAGQLQIKNEASFSLFEMIDDSGEKSERMLEEDERLLDVMASWEDMLKASQRKSGLNFKVVYRLKLFLSREEAFLSAEALNMYFIQGLYDVISMNYPCTEKDALMLGALAVQGVYGGDPIKYAPGILINKLSAFVPADLLQRRDSGYLEAKILQEHVDCVNLSRTDAKKKFLEFIKQWPIYGATFFRALQISRISKNPPEDVLLAVSERGLIVLDGKSKEVKKNYELSEILTYGYKEKSFLVVAGNLAQQKKLNFQTSQGKMINDLLLTYINRMMAYANEGGSSK